jgi:hypothetical protein
MRSHLGSLTFQLGEFGVPHRLPSSIDGPLAMLLARTQPNLLILIRKIQSARKPLKK